MMDTRNRLNAFQISSDYVDPLANKIYLDSFTRKPTKLKDIQHEHLLN